MSPPRTDGLAAHELDEMWLRQPVVSDAARLKTYRSQIREVVVRADVEHQSDEVSLQQLHTVADELGQSLTRLLGVNIPAACCNASRGDSGYSGGRNGTLTVHVSAAHTATLGMEGFALAAADGDPLYAARVDAATPSGALYGCYRLLSYVQRGAPLPQVLQDVPQMELRIWDLWDDLTGDVTRGFGGDSLIWPQAMWRDPNKDDGPPPTKLFLAPCDAADKMQHWRGAMLSKPGVVSGLENGGDGMCVNHAAFLTVEKCDAISPEDNHSKFWFNSTSRQISIGPLAQGIYGSRRTCFDINHGAGPDVGTYHCHPLYPGGGGERDYPNQQWQIEPVAGAGDWKQLASTGPLALGQCLTLRNSFPPSPAAPTGVTWTERLVQLMRLLKSAGMNGMVLNDVNACYGDNGRLLYPEILMNISKNLGPTMSRFGITPYISACFGAPTVMADVSSDPMNTTTQKWWADKADEIWGQWPAFGGFLVKADSEGNIGPLQFNRTEADGANLLARAVAPHDGASISICVHRLSTHLSTVGDIYGCVFGPLGENRDSDVARFCVRQQRLWH